MTKKSSDRHVGRRENIWFPWEEHEAMLKSMDAQKARNKSNFIRTAVHNYAALPIRRTERPWRSDIALKSRPVVPSAIILKGALMGARGEARRSGRSETSRHGVCRRSYGRRSS